MSIDVWLNAEFPKSWATPQLKELCEVVRGGSPRPMGDSRYFGGPIPFVKISDVTASDGRTLRTTSASVTEEGSRRSRLIRAGRLILSNSGTICVPIFLGVDACIHDGFVAFDRLTEGVSQEYLFHFFNYVRPHLRNKHKQGVTQVNLNTSIVGDITIPLPPLAEQKRIVAKIEELFSELEAGEESLRAARRQLGVYRQSLFKQAFEGKLTETWRAENPDKLESPAQLLARIQAARQARYEQELQKWQERMREWERGSKEERKPAKPSRLVSSSILESSDELPLHPLPDCWLWLRFDSVYTESVLGKMLDAEKNRGKPRPYLRNINVRWGWFDLNDLQSIKIEESEIDRYQVSPSDLVICEGGEPGRCAVWPENHKEPIFLQKALHRVRFPELILPNYVAHLMSFLAGTKLLERHFTGTTIKHLTGEGLAGVPVPICSLPEQQEIVRLLDEQFEAIERNEREIDAALKRSEALRQAILKKAFTGQLVAQDPADEPASALLARLHAERGATTQPGRSRRKV